MRCRNAILSLAVLWILIRSAIVSVAGQSDHPADPFALDGAHNILQTTHVGIVSGKLTSGIPYRNAAAVQGLWAPPYVSSDFSLGITVMGELAVTDHYTWHPFHVDRAGSIREIAMETVTILIPGHRAGVIELTLRSKAAEPRNVPVTISANGTLDRSKRWEFVTPLSKTPTTRKVAQKSLRLEQGDMAIAMRASEPVCWENSQPCGRACVAVSPYGSAKLYIVFAIGPVAEAEAACKNIAVAPAKAMANARAVYAERVRDLFQKLPTLESNNPAFVRLYNRSLVHLLMNRWDVPEFVLHPYYGTGSVNGGCVCNYLYNFAENWEIFPLFDAEAGRTHIKKFLALDMTRHFAFEPTTGNAFGPWYMVNQEKIIGLIYYYVKNTGDKAFLNERVNGKTILEHVIANATYGDDLAKPVAMIDYGTSNSHLELRRGLPYNHVMPDLNGRRYNNFLFAAELADTMGTSKTAAQLRQRAEQLKLVLKRRLWNKNTRWFDFQDDKGKKDTRYTLQIFKLFGSKVLDAEEETGLLGHLLSEREFLSQFGLHSLSKTDPAYDSADVDNGGPGACTCFPPQIAERLYKAGHPDAAENILKRILWWGDRMPYWGDSIVAERMDYRHDTPLQCTIDGAAVAQCIIFGMFGVSVEWSGDLCINPHPPAFAPRMELKGLRLRGHVLDIAVNGKQYEVCDGAHRIHAPIGQSVVIRNDKRIP